jgi:hypothetical protein
MGKNTKLKSNPKKGIKRIIEVQNVKHGKHEKTLNLLLVLE